MLSFRPILLFTFGLCLALTFSAGAEAQNRTRAKQSSSKNSQRAKTVINGAMVFRAPTFDSDVVSYLPEGKVYLVSRERRGPFFKILYAPKKFGWIADVDVETELQGRSGLAAKKKPDKGMPSDSEVDDITEVVTEEEKDEEIYFTRYVGPIFANINFTENTFAGTQTEALTMYGVKLAGPKLLFDSPTLTSVTLLVSGAPDYYEKITGNPASGWMALADLLLTTPFYGSRNYMFYYGMGPLVRWNQFQVKAGKTSLDLQDIHVGAVLELGAALQIHRFAFRLEYRYYWEVTSHAGLGLSLQTKF